jgi:predicted acetyltransferase
MTSTPVAPAGQDGAMSLPEGYRIVEVPESRRDELLEIDRLAFAGDAEDVPVPLVWARTTGVEAPGGELVAIHGSYPFALPVPGGTVTCSGLTWVGVRPDHRRRGLASAMVASHVARSIARGEAVSALFAAEAGIYGRFGYGCAADDVRATVPRGAALRPVDGSDELTVRFGPFDAAGGALVDAVHRAAGAGRPGWITRDTEPLRGEFLADPPARREGAEPLRLASVHAADGTPRAYAVLRRHAHWNPTGPAHTVRLRESAALDAVAAHRLWSFVLDLDLTASVETGILPLDDPLFQLLVDERAVDARRHDNLWVRLLDVPAALTARRYAAPLDTVLEVSDALVPANAGRWRVTTTAEAADDGWASSVTRTDDAPDLRLDVRDLAAAYLGGRSFAALARAGLVEEVRAGAALAAGRAFGWPVAPVCSWVF